MTDDYKQKYDDLMKRCEEFMRDFAPPSPYELGFKAGWEAAMASKKIETVVVPTQIAKTEDIMWPDRYPPTMVDTISIAPPTSIVSSGISISYDYANTTNITNLTKKEK
jgi:hypothetical protein